MTLATEQLESLKRRFGEWQADSMPALEDLPRYERRLGEFLQEVMGVCQEAGEESETIRDDFLSFLGYVDRYYQALSTLPLDPRSAAVVDVSQGEQARELADYLRAHGVKATTQTLYRRVRTGFFSSQIVPSGINVGAPKNFYPASLPWDRRK